MELKVPFIKQQLGAGDLVKAATSAAGIKPCKPCEERRKRMNDLLRLMPRGMQTAVSTGQWTKPPEVPSGWTREATYEVESDKRLEMFSHETGKLMIWHVIDGQYRQSHTFCCGDRMRETAAARWEELCRSL